MSKFNLEEIKEQYKGKTIAIVGNGPSLVTMPGKDALIQRHLKLMKGAGEEKDITGKENSRAVVKRIDGYHCPLWTVNGGWTYHPESTLGFLMDDHKFHGPKYHPQPEWYDGLVKNSEIPIITSKEYDTHPALVAFPLEEAIKRFRMPYYGETIDYMIVFAILCEVKCIEFLGCDYSQQDRFPGERAGTEFWCGVAHESGIEIKLQNSLNLLKCPDREDMFKPRFYGYAKDTFPYTDKEIMEMIWQGKKLG